MSDSRVGQVNDSTPDTGSASGGGGDSVFASFLQSMYSSDSMKSSTSSSGSSGSDSNGYKSTQGQMALAMDNAFSQLAGGGDSISQAWANQQKASEAQAKEGAEKKEAVAASSAPHKTEQVAEAPKDGAGNQLASDAKVNNDGSIEFGAWAADQNQYKKAA